MEDKMHFGVSATCNMLILGGYENKTFQAAVGITLLGGSFLSPHFSRRQMLFTSLSGEQINEDLEFVLNSSESLAGGDSSPAVWLRLCLPVCLGLSWTAGVLGRTTWLFVRHSLPIRKVFPGKVVILLHCLDICCVTRRGVSLLSEPPSSLHSSFETEKGCLCVMIKNIKSFQLLWPWPLRRVRAN